MRNTDEKRTMYVVGDQKLVRQGIVTLFEKEFTVLGEGAFSQGIGKDVQKLRPHFVLLHFTQIPLDIFQILNEFTNSYFGSQLIIVCHDIHPALASRLEKLGVKAILSAETGRAELLSTLVRIAAAAPAAFTASAASAAFAIGHVAVGNPKSPGARKLTTREIEIIRYVSSGFSSKEIAKNLNISCNTVEVHRHNILKKLNLKRCTALVNYFQKEMNAAGLKLSGDCSSSAE